MNPVCTFSSYIIHAYRARRATGDGPRALSRRVGTSVVVLLRRAALRRRGSSVSVEGTWGCVGTTMCWMEHGRSPLCWPRSPRCWPVRCVVRLRVRLWLAIVGLCAPPDGTPSSDPVRARGRLKTGSAHLGQVEVVAAEVAAGKERHEDPLGAHQRLRDCTPPRGWPRPSAWASTAVAVAAARPRAGVP